MSAPKKDKTKNTLLEHEFKARTHQLERIFEIIGTPEKEDIQELDEGVLKTFLMGLPKQSPQSFETLLPSASPDAIALLKSMLVFSNHVHLIIMQIQKNELPSLKP